MSGSPEELLRSALEKIVFFECRVDQLEAEVETARATAARAREEAGASRRRETDLEVALARARAEEASARTQAAELAERVRLLEAEKQRFLTGLVERARLQGAPGADDREAGPEVDLAAFISELRGEIERLQGWKRAGLAAGLAVEDGAPPRQREEPPMPLPEVAARFEESGRSRLTGSDTASLSPALATRSERALYEASLDDLASPDAGRRRRAADCLRALGSASASPLLAASLGRESDGEVKSALLGALAALGEPSAAHLAARELSDARPPVRAAALEAVVALERDGALPRLAAALGDVSPVVRRRAAVLLGFTPGDASDEALSSALADRDAGVARAAAVALSGRPSAKAQGALARALDHREPAVRRAAARAVERWAGEKVDASAPEPERRRTARRISEKLLDLDRTALSGAVTRVDEPPALAPAAARPARSRDEAPARSPGRPRGQVAVPPARVAAERPAAAGRAAVAEADPALASSIVAELRTALRGRSAEELSQALSSPGADVLATLRWLVAQGALVARGPRFFVS